ncbi:AtpZ/AtpI family protein [Methylobacter sp. YRD-M1]|uniref:AtpZ/AtpI family protein n=1 Tax=Methylobacter sp. YRD-M1 TaxID=2911520 RepID=UPI00227C51E7|nr:AtpZ/AtpI family protein [Methylobacter sp. YRD-M1]WAK03928.1 AtpZ/AtpI family protein [Methylobacter sp. YRD-M1]
MMTEHEPESPEDKLSRSVDRQARRKLKARRDGRRSVWFGLGMFGLIGWSIAIPTLAGIALGLWIDRRWPGPVSWTLTLLFVGVTLGCINAWRWIDKERQ